MKNNALPGNEPVDVLQAPVRKNGKAMRQDTRLVNVLRTALEQTMDEDGWANLASIGQYINNNTSL